MLTNVVYKEQKISKKDRIMAMTVTGRSMQSQSYSSSLQTIGGVVCAIRKVIFSEKNLTLFEFCENRR